MALEFSWDLRERLSDLALALNGGRWVPPENLHLTLRFIGEVQRHLAQEIDASLAAVGGRGFALEIAGVGASDKAGRLVSVWAGVRRSPELEHLQGKIETALQRAGLPAERRRFTPHITLAKLDGGTSPAQVIAWVQANNLLRLPPVPISAFTLFSSHLSTDHPIYTPEVHYDLK